MSAAVLYRAFSMRGYHQRTALPRAAGLASVTDSEVQRKSGRMYASKDAQSNVIRHFCRVPRDAKNT